MPAKLFDPAKPTFYLDNSTLSSAWKAHRHDQSAGAYAAFAPLIPWVERVATEANLCLSYAHILEPENWADRNTARAMIEWYDGLPTVWMRSRFDDADEFEAEYWTKVAVGVRVDGDGEAFAPSLLTAFRAMSVENVRRLLSEPKPLLALFDAKIDLVPRVNAFIDLLVQVAQDHQWADAQQWTDERKQDRMAYNIRVALRTAARSADRRLALREDTAYAAKGCTGGDVQDLLVALYEREPRAMPLFRVDRRFVEGASARIKRGEVRDGRVSNAIRNALKGSLCDWIHVMGAAYCDVFTCDGAVSDWLGNLRTTMGLRPQLALQGHPGESEGFVQALIGTWP
jgi:hypothetical protein